MGFFDIFKKKQDSAAADIPESRQQQQEELSAGLEKTKTGIFSKLARAVAGRSTVDAEQVLLCFRAFLFVPCKSKRFVP